MRLLNVLLLVFLSFSSQAQDKKELIIFSGSDWCNSCLKLKKIVLSDSNVKSYIDSNFVTIIADFPRDDSKLTKDQIKRNEALAEKYNSSGIFPTIVILKSGKFIAKKEGYRGELPNEFIEWLKTKSQ